MEKPTGFLGTYFDRDEVLKLEFWARIISWGVLLAYTYDVGYNAFQIVYSALINSIPLDWWFLGSTVSKIGPGAVLFIILQVAAKSLLILMDIEDNTRRSARSNAKIG